MMGLWVVTFFLLLNVFGKPFMYHVLWRIENLSLTTIALSLNLSMLFEERYEIKEGSAVESVVLLAITLLNFVMILAYVYCIAVAAKTQLIEAFSDPEDPDNSLSWQEIKTITRIKFYRSMSPVLATLGIRVRSPEEEVEQEINEMIQAEESVMADLAPAARARIESLTPTSRTREVLHLAAHKASIVSALSSGGGTVPAPPGRHRSFSTRISVCDSPSGGGRRFSKASAASSDDAGFGAFGGGGNFDPKRHGVGEEAAGLPAGHQRRRRTSSIGKSFAARRKSGVSRHSAAAARSTLAMDAMPPIMVKELGYHKKFPSVFDAGGKRRSKANVSLSAVSAGKASLSPLDAANAAAEAYNKRQQRE